MKRLRFMLLAVSFFMTAPLFAMPTVAAVEKARPIISELMAEDLAALRSGKKTPVAVGDAAMALVANAETEAAKYVLAKAAFGLYLRGKDYDKATDALEQLRASIPDLPAADFAELVQKGAKGVRGREAPRLFAFYRQVQSQATAEKEVARAKTLLAESPTPEHRRAYAEWCVLAGDWKTALASFAKLDGDLAKAANDETSDPGAAADFWWSYELTIRSTSVKNPADAFKQHAAGIYKRCMKDGTLTGLKKNLAEKRIAQLEESVTITEGSSSNTKAVTPPKYNSRSYVQKGLTAQWDGIDNVGTGRHSNRATVWKDLKGDFDMVLRSAGQVEENCVTCKGKSFAAVSKKKIDSNKIVCAEIVFEYIEGSENSVLFCTGVGKGQYYERAMGFFANGLIWGNSVIRKRPLKIESHHFDFSNKKCFINGKMQQIDGVNGFQPFPSRGHNFSFGGFADSGVKCRIYSIRFYDRSLTPEEIRLNYEIDHSRFQ